MSFAPRLVCKLISVIFIALSSNVFANNFDHLLDANGEAILNVRQMVFDKQGYLWLGGDEGVWRFDGYQKIHVNSEPTARLFLDQQQRFWSSGTTTLLAFEYPNLSNNEIKPEHEITHQMYQTDTGRQFFATNEGLSEYFYQHNRFDHYDINIPSSEAKLSITALLKTPSEQLLIGSKRGLYQIPIASINGASKSLDVAHPLIADVSISTLNFYQDRLYVGTDNGLYIIDSQGQIAAHYQHQANDPQSLTHNNVTAVLIDHLGYLWVGTSKGLNQQAPNERHFSRFYQNDNDPSSITNNLITSLHQDNQQNILIATYSGIDRYHHTDIHLKPHPQLSKLQQSINNVWSLAQDQQHNLWIGTFGSGLIRLSQDGSARQFSPDKTQANTLASNRIPSLYIDYNQQLLIGTNKGLQRFDRIAQSFHTVPLIDKNERNKTHEQIFDIAQSSNVRFLTSPKAAMVIIGLPAPKG